MASSDTKLVKEDDVHAFVVRCMEKAGTSTVAARALADVITACDVRAVFSHGLNRLGKLERTCLDAFVGFAIYIHIVTHS